jgi:hypothetical protein
MGHVGLAMGHTQATHTLAVTFLPHVVVAVDGGVRIGLEARVVTGRMLDVQQLVGGPAAPSVKCNRSSSTCHTNAPMHLLVDLGTLVTLLGPRYLFGSPRPSFARPNALRRQSAATLC